MYNVLFVPYGYVDSLEYWENYNGWLQNCILPLKDSGLASNTVMLMHTVEDMQRIINYIEYKTPDLVVLGRYGDDIDIHPSLKEFIAIIKQHCSVTMVWGDCTVRGDVQRADDMAEEASFIVNLDRHEAPFYSVRKEKYLPLWSAQDHFTFYNPHKERKHRVCFIGERFRPERERVLSYLENQNINVFMGNSRNKTDRTILDYAKILQESKMSINITSHVYAPHLKGRVIESISCGCCLLEQHYDNGTIQHYFEPWKEYVPFRDEKDLVHILNTITEEQIRDIAKAGETRYWRNYSPTAYWKKIIERVKHK